MGMALLIFGVECPSLVKLFFFILMFMSVLPAYISGPSACGDQKKASDSMKLELQVAVSCHVTTGTQTRVLCKSSQCSQPLVLQAQLNPFGNILIDTPRGMFPW